MNLTEMIDLYYTPILQKNQNTFKQWSRRKPTPFDFKNFIYPKT